MGLLAPGINATEDVREARMKTRLSELAPDRITHMLTFTFKKNLNATDFNSDHVHQAADIHRTIIDTLDDTIYRPSGVKKRPRAERFPFLSKGETRSRQRMLAHLHFHFLVDLGDEREIQRFAGLRKQFHSNLFRKLENRFGLHVRLHVIKVRPGPYSHARITDYLGKDILIDVVRIYARQTY